MKCVITVTMNTVNVERVCEVCDNCDYEHSKCRACV